MIKLSEISTDPPKGLDKKEAREQTREWARQLGEIHERLIASQSHSVLVILQGMDASGKDGAVKNIFRYCTHNNFGVYSFKKPTEEEFAHDFLWRVHRQCPAKGHIQVFNRSHYEDVLIQRVHRWIDEKRVRQRLEAIDAFEKLIQFDNNTVLFKFFLHISHDQQKLELQQRIDEREKNWKHNENDWKEREHWDEYMRCYEEVLNFGSTPWTVVPVDSRWYRDYVISKTMVEKLEKLELEYPPLKK